MAQIHSYIKNFTAQAGYQFYFSVWWMLKMHSPDCSLIHREGVVDLNDGLSVQYGLQFVDAKEAFQISTVVIKRFMLNDM